MHTFAFTSLVTYVVFVSTYFVVVFVACFCINLFCCCFCRMFWSSVSGTAIEPREMGLSNVDTFLGVKKTKKRKNYSFPNIPRRKNIQRIF